MDVQVQMLATYEVNVVLGTFPGGFEELGNELHQAPGLTVALIDGILRLMNNQYSLFFALLFVSALVPLLRLFVPMVAARPLTLSLMLHHS